VSLIPGGFQECHELALRFPNFLLDNHDTSNCYHCRKAKRDGQW
jgi:hypothetical protein